MVLLAFGVRGLRLLLVVTVARSDLILSSSASAECSPLISSGFSARHWAEGFGEDGLRQVVGRCQGGFGLFFDDVGVRVELICPTNNFNLLLRGC